MDRVERATHHAQAPDPLDRSHVSQYSAAQLCGRPLPMMTVTSSSRTSTVRANPPYHHGEMCEASNGFFESRHLRHEEREHEAEPIS